MTTYKITSKAGLVTGVYEGTTAAEAIEAMGADGAIVPDHAAWIVEEIELPTARQIEALRDEAGTAGDLDMVAVCERALDDQHDAIIQCAEVIADARGRA